MKKIKFRGKDRDNMFQYGDLTHEGNLVFVDEIRVDPDSVAQFVGYDVDENEIYEGDICIEKNYCLDEKTELVSSFTYINGNDTPQHFSYYKLKGK